MDYREFISQMELEWDEGGFSSKSAMAITMK